MRISKVTNIVTVWFSNTNVEIFQIEARIGIAKNFVVSLNNLLDVFIDEIIEGIDVLFHEAFH